MMETCTHSDLPLCSTRNYFEIKAKNDADVIIIIFFGNIAPDKLQLFMVI